MRYILNKKIMAVIVLVAIAASLIIVFSRKGSEKSPSGPEITLENFHKAILSGDFDLAKSLCDSVSMKTYIDEYISTWERMQQEDSSMLAIASTLLSDTELKIEGTEKTEKGRRVHYTIEAAGEIKERTATLKKEEGEWRVKTITERI